MTRNSISLIPENILLVEDSQADAYLIGRELAARWPAVRVSCVSSRDALAEKLADGRWDVVLSDYDLPSFSGPAALALCLEMAPGTPFLVVSGKIGEDAAVSMMKAGACNFIVKDRLSMLVPAIEREIREARLRQEHLSLERQFLRAQRLENIGMMASGIAHDLNNIFLPIMMVTSLLKRRLTDEEGRKYIALLEDSTSKGSALTGQMLSFLRGDKTVDETSSVGAVDLLQDLLKMIGTSFPKQITVVDDSDGPLWPVLGNANQIHQALLNLCINARDAMPGGGTLRLGGANATLDAESAKALSEDAREGDFVAFSVTDMGGGIPKSLQERVFEAFFTTKPVGKGTGLGLSTVLKIARNHQGFVTLRSIEGSGSVFTVFIPAALSGPKSAAPPDAPDQSMLAERGETILVVDDEKAILHLVKEALESVGYRVLTASDGAEALHRFGEHHETISAVVLDYMMPVLDGPETVRTIRRISPGVPILYISGSDPKQVEKHREGVQGVLAKPFSMEALLSQVRDVIDRSK